MALLPARVEKGAPVSSLSFGLAGNDSVSDIGHIATTRLLLQTLALRIPKSTGSFLWDVCEPSNLRLKLSIFGFSEIFDKF